MSKLLKAISFGEPDANAEYVVSLRAKKEPLYIQAWSTPEIQDYDAYLTGQKFIVTGQKGTGKTAILRYMDYQARKSGYETEFVVFKNEILQEAELLKIDNSSVNGSIVEEDKLKESKFYYHAIKRIMISLLISKLKAIQLEESVNEKDLMSKLFGVNGKEALRFAFDSIVNVVQSANIDVNKVTRGILNIDPGQLVKKANDDLLNRFLRIAKTQKARVKIFFDEMHFAFRDKDTLRADAALVRDTILAAQALNERFAEENLDIVVYLALRREFLDQPEIAQADIVHVVESYGEKISWEHYPATSSHPIFDFITLRFKAALGSNFTKSELMSTYLREIDPVDLLNYTWSKPRDIVRFFRTAQTVNGNTVVISQTNYKTILKHYSAQSWQEVKSALAAFVPIDAIPLLERGLKTIIPSQLDKSKNLQDFGFQKGSHTRF